MKTTGITQQPWLNSGPSDVVFILLPPFFALLLVILFPQQFQSSGDMPLVYWLILIVFIDVAHVYSTLYRTYFNASAFRAQQSLLLTVPLVCYIAGVICYSIGPLFFWRILAYLAVFHFIRQQYGFMRLYSRFEKQHRAIAFIDTVTIYAATIYPLLYWHLSGDRNFSWFVPGDFATFQSAALARVSLIAYGLILAVYLVKELVLLAQTRQWNVPRNLLIIGTALSWYFGIVYFNGDMAFTTLNVVSHGIPYMALIWFFEGEKYKKSGKKATNPFYQAAFGQYGILSFVVLLALFAYLEEGLWDGLVWKEHISIFGPFSWLPRIKENELLTLLLPLLALPQSTHYVLDGFIWRRPRLEHK